MSLRINHNISSINGHRQLLKNEGMMAKSLERLSSGLRINRAADDAAGLVISEQMRAQISGLKQGINNSETAISMVQTSEGALDEVNTLLTKARELTLHAANEGANDVNQLSADQTELDNVIQSITRISDVTQFGTKKMLDGSLNGAKDLAASIAHVKVGNLANNPGINAGLMSLNVTAATKESMTLKGGSSSDSYIFSAGVTGTTLGSASVNSGVSVSLKLDNLKTVALVTTGSMTATSLASALDALATQHGFDVAATTGGEIKVTNQAYGNTDFASAISFTRAETAVSTGTNESVKATLNVTSPSTSAGAAAVLFTAGSSVAGISGIQETSVLAKTGTVLSYSLSTATGGTFAGSYTSTAGDTMAVALSGLQTQIQAHASFSGASLALAGSTGAGAINFSLARGNDTITTDFNFSLSIDFTNSANTQSEVEVLSLTGATFNSTGASPTFTDGSSGVAGTAITTGSFLASGSAINLTVNGQTVTYVGTGGGTAITGVAAGLQSAVQALAGGLSGYQVGYLGSGAALTGIAGYAGATGQTTPTAGFVVSNTNGVNFSVSLAVDQTQGNDVAISSVQTQTGTQAGATLDLTTVSQSGTSNVATTALISGRTVSSTSGASTIQSGVDAAATMTSSNGVVLNLEQQAINADGTFSVRLTTGMNDIGYKDFKAELSSTLLANGGASNFTLTQGAVFQVGANALQQVAFTIQDTSSDELGRGASSKLSSMEDMLSSKKGALLNGMSTEALAVIDAAIDEVTNLRGRLGAFQANALESGLNSLRVSYENLTAAESTIRDVDFAEESANFTRNQILVQASTSMLAQANQMPQNVLKLLG